MTNKIYMVCGLYDPSRGDDSIMDASPWIACFKTREEAEEACETVNDFYFEKCHYDCDFEIREIDLDNLETLERLNQNLEQEYKDYCE